MPIDHMRLSWLMARRRSIGLQPMTGGSGAHVQRRGDRFRGQAAPVQPRQLLATALPPCTPVCPQPRFLGAIQSWWCLALHNDLALRDRPRSLPHGAAVAIGGTLQGIAKVAQQMLPVGDLGRLRRTLARPRHRRHRGHERHQAHSSMPTTRGEGWVSRSVARTSRSSVSPLAGMDSHPARHDPASPPGARPMWRWMPPRRAVRRARGDATPDRRSAKTRRGQPTLAQQNRRARTWMTTAHPCQGRSASVRVSWLWT